MVEFTPEERQTIALAYLDGDSHDTAKAASVGDAKDIFCKNWDMVKTVLNYLKPFVPKPVSWAISALIVAGDLLHKKIC